MRTAAFPLCALALCSLGCAPQPVEPEREVSQPNQPVADQLEGQASRLLDEGDATFRAGRASEANAVYKLAAEAAEREAKPGVQGEALAMVARCYAVQRAGVAQGKPFLLRAGDLANPERPRAYARYLAARGAIEVEAGAEANARITLGELARYGTAHGLPAWSADGAQQLALLSAGDERQRWIEQGLEAARAADDPLWIGRHARLLGDAHLDAERFAPAAAAYEQAADAFARAAHDDDALACSWALGHARRLAGEGDAARAVLDRVVAEAQARWDRFHQPADAGWLGRALWDLGELDAAAADTARALERLRTARERLRAAGFPRAEPERFAALEARIAALED